MNNLTPESASSYAGNIDGLILLIAIVVGVWFLIAEFAIIGMLFKYRESAHPESEYVNEKKLKKWVNIPHFLVIICDVVLIWGAIKVWVNVKQNLPEQAQELRITAQQWSWTFQHPGLDKILDTEDDIVTIDTLHLEENITYIYHLGSKDVVHSLSIPAFRLKQDAVPGRQIKGWFEPILPGQFDIQCAEICGLGHGMMAAQLHVDTEEEHQSWLKSHEATTVAATPGEE
jgi:cytochrome c oxidase subunit II